MAAADRATQLHHSAVCLEGDRLRAGRPPIGESVVWFPSPAPLVHVSLGETPNPKLLPVYDWVLDSSVG